MRIYQFCLALDRDIIAVEKELELARARERAGGFAGTGVGLHSQTPIEWSWLPSPAAGLEENRRQDMQIWRQWDLDRRGVITERGLARLGFRNPLDSL